MYDDYDCSFGLLEADSVRHTSIHRLMETSWSPSYCQSRANHHHHHHGWSPCCNTNIYTFQPYFGGRFPCEYVREKKFCHHNRPIYLPHFKYNLKRGGKPTDNGLDPVYIRKEKEIICWLMLKW